MNLVHTYICSFVAALLLLITACNEPSLIGTDLVDEEQVDVLYTEAVPLQLTTLKNDSVLTYRTGAIPSGQPCGIFADPLFGTTTAQLYGELGLERSNWDFTSLLPEKVLALDLILPYNTNLCYGDFSDIFNYELYELDTDMNPEDDYYTNIDTIAFGPMPIGRLSDVISPFDSTSILDYRSSDTVLELRYPHLRIPLEELFKMQFVEQLAADTLNVENDANFQENVLKGLHLRASTPTAGLPVFDLQSRYAGIRMVYEEDGNNDGTVTPGEIREYLFPFSSITFGGAKAVAVDIEHDYTGTFADDFVSNPNTQDTMLIQGTVGLLGEVAFPDLSGLENIIVNQAILEVTVLDLPDDNPNLYPPIDLLRVIYKDEVE
ncbi:MAG: DUF4270 family protein, partial [Bacteroidota bacterium]